MQRFWSKVDKSGECWEWQACRDIGGYGLFRIGGRRGKTWKAHRFAWVLTFGPIPDGVLVLHHCDNRRCVRPDHLYLGDQVANMRDRLQRNRESYQMGSRTNTAKLTEADIPVIRARLAAGEIPRVIAEDYGVSRAAIAAVKTGLTWSYVA